MSEFVKEYLVEIISFHEGEVKRLMSRVADYRSFLQAEERQLQKAKDVLDWAFLLQKAHGTPADYQDDLAPWKGGAK